MDSGPIKRFLWLTSFFAAFVAIGIVTLQVGGGSTGSITHDAYRLVAMFALNGEWAFSEGMSPLLEVLAFLAPLVAIIGIIELLGRSLVGRVRREWKLRSMRDHVVVFGLNNESLLLMEGIQRGPNPPRVVVLGDALGDQEKTAMVKLGAVLIDDSGSAEERLARASVERADVLISFMSGTDESLTLLADLDSYLSGRGRMRGRDPLDFWIKVDNPKLGDRLAEYFGFTDLQERLHPRFFSLEETSARRLWRTHPLDAFAEAQGQSRVHLCIYGFDSLAEQIMTEAVRQTLPSPEGKLKITVLTDEPKRSRDRLLAWRPGLFRCADIAFEQIPFHRVGISDADYPSLPVGATAHVVCHKDPDAAAATALSLRRLLLAKPPGTPEAEPRRLNAPILVRFDRPTGIGKLLSGADDDPTTRTTGWPDGVEVFGGYDEMLVGDMRDALEPTVIDTAREAIARNIHLSYQAGVSEAAKLARLDENAQSPAQRKAEQSWRVLAPEFRDSCRHAADHLWPKARALGSRIVYAPADSEPVPARHDQLERLTALEHRRWVDERLLAGWSYAEKRVDAAKQHPNLKDYGALSTQERHIDQTLAERMGGALSAGRLAMRREYIVGITGHRHLDGRPLNEKYVYESIRAELQSIMHARPGEAIVLYTALATGADSLAVDAARACGLPYVAVLPLPFEASRTDYEQEPNGIARFLDFTANADRVIELPLKFGDLADVALDKAGRSVARDQQYALAGGYIARRCHALIAVWDGKPALGLGGTGDIVRWAETGAIPQQFTLEGPFSRSMPACRIHLIHPTPDDPSLATAAE